MERTKIHQDTILVSMDVASLYTNIPQEEGITTVCRAYDTFHNNNPPIPTKYLREMLDLILKENSFQFNGENYLQTHGTAMGTKIVQLLLHLPGYGIKASKTSICSLNKLTSSNHQSNLQVKFQRTKILSLTQ